jgi:hypothetical protein
MGRVAAVPGGPAVSAPLSLLGVLDKAPDPRDPKGARHTLAPTLSSPSFAAPRVTPPSPGCSRISCKRWPIRLSGTGAITRPSDSPSSFAGR